jgi:peptide/nickel transport system substrate-binding protein
MAKPRAAMAVAVVTAVVVVSLSGVSLGQSASPADEKVTFTVGVTGDLNSANPFRQIDTTESFLFGLMYDGILRLGQADYATEPELLESWDTSEDGLTWTFVLRDDITWSDGQPITADDFVWTGNFVIDNDISSWSDGYRFTDEIRALDERTIEWTTTRPTLVPGLPGYSLVLPEHIWGQMTTKEIKQFRNFPNSVGSGPFTLEEWEPGEFWRLEARQDYYHGAPHIDEIVFRVYNSDESVVQALIKGEIDHTVVATPGLFERVRREDPDVIGTAVTSAEAFHQLSFNIVDDPKSTANPAVKDPVVREAVSWAIDRETLVERVLRGYGEPGTTPIVPLYDYWHWEPPAEEKIGFDPAEANRLLDEAGYMDTDDDGVRELPGGGQPLEWRLFVATTDPQGINAAPFIQGWLRDVGIESSVRSMTDSKLYDQWYGFDWDLILYSWGVGPDPDFILSSFTSNQCGYWSDTCYANQEYDQLYKEQQTTLDPEARQDIVVQMQQMIYRDTPEIVLWYPNTFEAWRADRWTGFLRWPEPDGVVFWGNPYSAINVRPVGDAASRATGDSGLPAGIWIGAVALVIVAIGGVVLARRRRDEHYAA